MNRNYLAIAFIALSALAVGLLGFKPWSQEPLLDTELKKSTRFSEPPTQSVQPQLFESIRNSPPIEIASPSPQVISTEPTEKEASQLADVIGLLENVSASVQSLDERMTALEYDMEVNRLNGLRPAEPEEDTDSYEEPLDDEQPTTKQLERSAARQVYFQDLEANIVAGYNQILSQEITSSYETFLASDPRWADKTSLGSTECGSGFCKVVITYTNDLDPLAQFELDGGIYMSTASHFSNSTVRERNLADGVTEMTIYFADKQTKLPVLP